MWTSAAERDEIEEYTATLPPQALRNLALHTAIHLDVEWRDLAPWAWEEVFTGLDGRPIAFRATVPARAGLLWKAALGLGNGGRLADAPDAIRRAIRPASGACGTLADGRHRLR